MNIVLFIIFLIFFLGNKSDKKKSDLFKGLLTFAIITAVIGSISPIFWIIAIGLIIFVASQKKSDKSQSDKAEYEKRKAEWERQRNLKRTADTATSKEEYERRRREWEQQHGTGSKVGDARTSAGGSDRQTTAQSYGSRKSAAGDSVNQNTAGQKANTANASRQNTTGPVFMTSPTRPAAFCRSLWCAATASSRALTRNMI